VGTKLVNEWESHSQKVSSIGSYHITKCFQALFLFVPQGPIVGLTYKVVVVGDIRVKSLLQAVIVGVETKTVREKKSRIFGCGDPTPNGLPLRINVGDIIERIYKDNFVEFVFLFYQTLNQHQLIASIKPIDNQGTDWLSQA